MFIEIKHFLADHEGEAYCDLNDVWTVSFVILKNTHKRAPNVVISFDIQEVFAVEVVQDIVKTNHGFRSYCVIVLLLSRVLQNQWKNFGEFGS